MVATIEYIERVIETYERATDANAHTEAREGNIIELKKAWADEVMITGDLHGHRTNFNLIRRIADLDKHARRHLIIQEVCHGGPVYPNSGGCMSHMMLEDVAKLKAQFPDRVHFLLCNHEVAELTDYPILKNQKMLNLLFRFGLQEAYGPAADKVREAYLPFIRTLPLAVRVEHGIWISHTLPETVDSSGLDESIFDSELIADDMTEGTPVFRFLWGRDFRKANADAFAREVDATVLIHGHEPCPEGYSTPNDRQIILDSHADNGCYTILPVGEHLTHEDVVKRIRHLK